jgi:hypothetical protein
MFWIIPLIYLSVKTFRVSKRAAAGINGVENGVVISAILKMCILCAALIAARQGMINYLNPNLNPPPPTTVVSLAIGAELGAIFALPCAILGLLVGRQKKPPLLK